MTHPFTWLLWLTSITICAWSSRNPFVLIVLLLIIGVVRQRYTTRDERPPAAALYWMFGVGALFNALWTHTGDTVLLRLPERLPLIGGPITAEALSYGIVNAMALFCMLHAFDALQRALPVSEILRMAPRALHPVTVVVVIAVTYVPMARQRARAVQTAQAVRGHEIRGIRDWLPLLMPLLIGALEHAMQLAEAMAARGYGRSIGEPSYTPSSLSIIGLLSMLGGWALGTTTPYVTTGWGIVAGGAALFGAALWLLRRRSPRTALRSNKFGSADLVGIAGACVAAVGVSVPSPISEAIAWTPYPALQWPAFPALLGPLLFGLCLPALFTRTGTKST